MAGTQCPLRLYNLLHRPVEASPPNEVQAAIFATSRELEALAAQSFPKTSFDIPIDTYETNILGTSKLLEAIKNYSNN